MNKTEIIDRLKSTKEILYKTFGIKQIGLFGSYAADRATSDSDIDLVFLLEDDYKIGFTKQLELEAYLNNLLNQEKIDLVNYKYINPIIKLEMEKSVIYV